MVEAKDCALLSSRDADLLEPTDWPKGSVCAQPAPARLGFPGALPQRRVVLTAATKLKDACSLEEKL